MRVGAVCGFTNASRVGRDRSWHSWVKNMSFLNLQIGTPCNHTQCNHQPTLHKPVHCAALHPCSADSYNCVHTTYMLPIGTQHWQCHVERCKPTGDTKSPNCRTAPAHACFICPRRTRQLCCLVRISVHKLHKCRADGQTMQPHPSTALLMEQPTSAHSYLPNNRSPSRTQVRFTNPTAQMHTVIMLGHTHKCVLCSNQLRAERSPHKELSSVNTYETPAAPPLSWAKVPMKQAPCSSRR